MKVLLQHAKTGLYFQDPGVWVTEIEAAFDFKTSQSAIDFARREAVSEVQVVAAFVGDGYRDSVVYPIDLRRMRGGAGSADCQA